MELIEEACISNCQGNYRKAVEKAKEASNKERNLIRFQEQAGLGDSHNMDLTYSVSKLQILPLKKFGFFVMKKTFLKRAVIDFYLKTLV